ncbi:MAG: 5-(carboxyamino)imidazole ribonucleotide synthase [Planctomycetes bacterium]|nr:5-(carboxyamino)imidazole ribonucleotide synthase [Planctomycetota bacterium]
MNEQSSWVGIVGGGQLGALLCDAAHALGLGVAVLDRDPRAPALTRADVGLVGDWDDASALLALASHVDVITFERDDVGVAALRAAEAQGVPVFPAPECLEQLQDKLTQRQRLEALGLPGPRFAPCEAATPEACEAFGLPLVQKLRRGGYDGRGVQVVRTPADFARLLPGPAVLEAQVEIARELAVLVARSRSGEVAVYPVCEVEVDPQAHRLDVMLAPARLPAEVLAAARALGERTVVGLGGVGVFAVELFLDAAGRLLVNEVSPRVHNSGHHTLDASPTSQFEQHLRAVCGLPLGPATLEAPVALVNVVGGGTRRGAPGIEGLEVARQAPGARVHLYDKAEVWPGRKMGHVTVVGPDAESALREARRLRGVLRVAAREEP